MKTIFVLSAILALALSKPQTYDPKYDDFNVQEVVDNTRLLKAYGNCFLDKGPCTPEGSDFKKIIPDAIQTTCGKCTPKQRQLIRTVVNGFKSKTPDIWEQLVKKEDPEGKYKETLDKFLSSSD